jgi:integrase
MTNKNRNRLRPLLSPQNQIKFLCLADKLLKLANKKGKTHRSALLVQTALIHEILIHAPLRLDNLVNLNINRHIKRQNNGVRSQLFIVIPADEVKNQEILEYELPEPTVRLFDRYMSEYRPILLKAPEEGWLFPGEVHGHKHEVTLREQLCRAVKKHTGLTVNPHLYRHVSAFFYLQAHPGDYETVRKLLAHRSVDTTMNFYAEFDGLAARRLYSQHILERKHHLEIKDRNNAEQKKH